MFKSIQIIDLLKILSKRRKSQYMLLLFLMTLSSIAEMISIGAVLPFLAAITAPEDVFNYQPIKPIIHFFEITKPNQIIFPFTVVFIIVVLFASAIRLTLLFFITRLSFATGSDISVEMYRRALYQDYSVHISRNSSEIINGVIAKTNVTINSVRSSLVLVSSIITIIGIMGVLLFVNTKIVLIIFLK